MTIIICNVNAFMKSFILTIFIVASIALTSGHASNLDHYVTPIASTLHEDLGPIYAQSGWFTFKKIEEKNGFKIYRRYAYLPEGFKLNDTLLPNILLYKCSREPSKIFSHLTIVIPKYFARYAGIANKNEKNSLVYLLIDEKYPLVMSAEFSDNEIFIDEHGLNRSEFHKILNSDSLKISTSVDDPPLSIIFTERVDSFFRDAENELDIFKSFIEKNGKLKHFSRYEMDKDCKKYQQNRK